MSNFGDDDQTQARPVSAQPKFESDRVGLGLAQPKVEDLDGPYHCTKFHPRPTMFNPLVHTPTNSMNLVFDATAVVHSNWHYRPMSCHSVTLKGRGGCVRLDRVVSCETRTPHLISHQCKQT